MDINEVIVSLTKEYIKPLFPVYKITYFQTHVIFTDDDDNNNILHTCRKESLFMLKEIDELITYSNKEVFAISQKAIDKYNIDKYLMVDGDCPFENIIIVDIIKVA